MKTRLICSALFLVAFALVLFFRAKSSPEPLAKAPEQSVSLEEAMLEKVDAPMQVHAKAPISSQNQ